jgi:hypothetical protein
MTMDNRDKQRTGGCSKIGTILYIVVASVVCAASVLMDAYAAYRGYFYGHVVFASRLYEGPEPGVYRDISFAIGAFLPSGILIGLFVCGYFVIRFLMWWAWDGKKEDDRRSELPNC